MTHDPDKHHRQSIRLKGHDYAQPGAYFVTICTRDRQCLFGHVVNGEMRLNEAGQIAQRCWEDIPHHFPHAVLDAVTIMPNHVHGIIVITESGRGEASVPGNSLGTRTGRTDASPLREGRPNGTQPRSLSAIMQNFKSICTRKTNTARGAPATPVWQRGFYEHVIRTEAELMTIREYVLGNPSCWDDDEDNPASPNSGR